MFIAHYDYYAQDDNEVTFIANDVMVDVREIDEVWLYGTVERTGIRGMFPSDYVEVI